MEDENAQPQNPPRQFAAPAPYPLAWRRQRCPMCDSRPANELQAMQKFCHSCNAHYHKG